MLEHTKKPRTEKLIQITITGPAANREKVIRGVKKFGYSDTSPGVRLFRNMMRTMKRGSVLLVPAIKKV